MRGKIRQGKWKKTAELTSSKQLWSKQLQKKKRNKMKREVKKKESVNNFWDNLSVELKTLGPKPNQ